MCRTQDGTSVGHPAGAPVLSLSVSALYHVVPDPGQPVTFTHSEASADLLC